MEGKITWVLRGRWGRKKEVLVKSLSAQHLNRVNYFAFLKFGVSEGGAKRL